MYKIFVTLILAFSLSFLFLSCSDDVTNSGNGGTGTGSGWHPNLNFTPGQVFVYTNDSLHPGGSGHTWTGVKTTSTLLPQTTYMGELCYPVTGVNYDTGTGLSTPDLPYWIRYDQNSGKFYQYGIQQLISPGSAGSWDLVGNFDAARGTSYLIANVSYPIPLPPPYGTINFTGPLNGKIADSTAITSGTNQSIPCYRIEMTASIAGSFSGLPIASTITVDYYLGWSSPTGLVEIKLKPFGFTVQGIPVAALNQPGFDRKLYSHTP